MTKNAKLRKVKTMHEFYAFDVGGDAFLLKRKNENILFDGGNSPKQLPKNISQCNVSQLNVVVCSHHDHDHLSGIKELIDQIDLKQAHITINELWVPAFWHALEHNKTTIKTALTALIENETSLPTSNNLRGEEMDSNLAAWIQAACACIKNHPRKRQKNERLQYMLRSVERITSTIKKASSLNIKIRYFEYGLAPKPTPMLPLTPVNSREVTTSEVLTRYNHALLQFKKLTPQNRTSLAFYAPETDSDNGVLFCADSDFSTCFFPPKQTAGRELIITAPHHGSDTNRSSYPIISNTFPTAKMYVCGTHYSAHPICNLFKQQHALCTNNTHCPQCRGSQKSSGTVKLTCSSGNWNVVSVKYEQPQPC